MGIFPVINGDWNTLFVSIFRNIWTIWDLSDPSGPELEQLVWVCLRVVSAYSPRSQDSPDATGATRGHLGMPGRRELSSFRACRKVDISWDGLQFLCISLCWRLLKSMSYPVSEHAERLILAETVCNFHALAYAGDCSQICISWDSLQFLCINYAGDCPKVWAILSQSMQKGWY